MSSPSNLSASTISTDIAKAESWLKQHERLIIVFMVLLLAFFVLDKSLGVVASWEQHRASIAAETLSVDKTKADAELAQAKQMLADYQSALSQSLAANQKLAAAQQTRDQALSKQQVVDKTLPPSQLGERWQTLVGDSGIQPDTSGFNVSDTAALATVSKLEQVPALEGDLKDEQAKSANLQVDVDKANDLINQGKIAVNGLQLELVDKDKACTAQVTAAKAQARKGKLKAFGFGYGLGFVSGLVAHAFGF